VDEIAAGSSLQDPVIDASSQAALGERRYHWPFGRRPDDHPSLSEFEF
jgi:nuclear transport factor 2 (NTF2) superfamily protein